jgi:hypothetical protein
MLEEKKSKRQAFQQVLNEQREMYYTLPLRRARESDEGKNGRAKKVLNERLELTPEEIVFKQADEEESKLPQKEREEIRKKRPNKWWWYVIHIKEYTNEIKENYKLALDTQEELYGELNAEANHAMEWVNSLSEEQQVIARKALKMSGKQRETCIKFQNEMLQVWEEQLVTLHCIIKSFPPIE